MLIQAQNVPFLNKTNHMLLGSHRSLILLLLLLDIGRILKQLLHVVHLIVLPRHLNSFSDLKLTRAHKVHICVRLPFLKDHLVFDAAHGMHILTKVNELGPGQGETSKLWN